MLSPTHSAGLRSAGKKVEAASAAFDAFRAGRAVEAEMKKLEAAAEGPAAARADESMSAPAGAGGDEPVAAPSAVDLEAAAAARKEAEEAAAAKAATPMMNVMWKMTAIDVESTLKAVCDCLFKDESIAVDAMRRRAQGLLALGEAMVAAADRDGGEAGRKKRYFEAMAKMATGGMFGADDGDPGEYDGDAAEGGGTTESLTPEQVEQMKAAAAAQLGQMPVGEIKKMLSEAGADYSQCVEKAELVALLLEHVDISRT
eukprot:SAG11_NODE_387_length_9883_cov_9.365699_3_plen_258_part_00